MSLVGALLCLLPHSYAKWMTYGVWHWLDGEENVKGMICGDVNKEHDEEEWHGDDEKDEVHYGDGKEEEGNEDALYGDGVEEEDEQEALHSDNNEDNEEQGTNRYRSITELYEVTTQVTKCSLTSTEE